MILSFWLRLAGLLIWFFLCSFPRHPLWRSTIPAFEGAYKAGGTKSLGLLTFSYSLYIFLKGFLLDLINFLQLHFLQCLFLLSEVRGRFCKPSSYCGFCPWQPGLVHTHAGLWAWPDVPRHYSPLNGLPWKD